MGDELSSSSSPKNYLKFLCSSGGRILPRPPDGHLKYVGGDTRVVTVPRPLSFQDLRHRINGVWGFDAVVKYQLAPEDMDALVTVKSDEDVRYMVEEYDRLEAARSSPTASGGSSHGPRFRVFLFPASLDARKVPTVVNRYGAGHLRRVNSLEQRYIDAINGVHLSPPLGRRGNYSGGVVFTVASPGSSSGSASGENAALDLAGISSNRVRPIHKAHSSPNLQQAVEGGQRLHRHNHHHCLGSPQPLHHASGPPTRMGAGGRGGCSHVPVQHLRPFANGRHGAPTGTHNGNVACCHVDEFCCYRRSAEGWRVARLYP